MDTFCTDTAGIWRVIGFVIYMIRIAIPILIVLLGTLDLGKAVIAGEDKKIKEAQKTFIMRIIYGIAIFFVFPIVEVIFNVVGFDVESGNRRICWECATHPTNENCAYYANDDASTDSQDTDNAQVENHKNVGHSKEEA